eukprot:scaffold85014_cov36-Tisochrysis_lutea.AAC.3
MGIGGTVCVRHVKHACNSVQGVGVRSLQQRKQFARPHHPTRWRLRSFRRVRGVHTQWCLRDHLTVRKLVETEVDRES